MWFIKNNKNKRLRNFLWFLTSSLCLSIPVTTKRSSQKPLLKLLELKTLEFETLQLKILERQVRANHRVYVPRVDVLGHKPVPID